MGSDSHIVGGVQVHDVPGGIIVEDRPDVDTGDRRWAGAIIEYAHGDAGNADVITGKTVVVPTKIFWFLTSVMFAPLGATSMMFRSARAVSVMPTVTVMSVIAAGFGTLTLTVKILVAGAGGGDRSRKGRQHADGAAEIVVGHDDAVPAPPAPERFATEIAVGLVSEAVRVGVPVTIAAIESVTAIAVRFWGPVTNAFAESVMVDVTVLMVWIVDAARTPGMPVTLSPTNSPAVLLTFVTVPDPVVSVPVNGLGLTVIVVPGTMPVPLTSSLENSPCVLLMFRTEVWLAVTAPVNVAPAS